MQRPITPPNDPFPKPLIVGCGLLTPFGSLTETWHALLNGQFLTTHGTIPTLNPTHQSRAVSLALAAATAACSSIPPDILRQPDTALVVGTSKGPIDTWIALPLHMPPLPYEAGGLTPTGLADIAHELAAAFRIPGPRLTVSAACATGLLALIRACLLIRAREAKHVLVVATESALHPLFFAAYKRLGVLAPDHAGCRPFDQSRTGFLLTEAAAALFLHALEPHDPLPFPVSPFLRFPDSPPPLCPIIIDQFALGSDPTHLTASDPQARPLTNLLRRLTPGPPIDLIHAHATGTVTHDPIELAAIESCLPDSYPKPILYSHKGALGHTIGAAGLVSIVLNCLAHQHAIIPGNVQTPNPLPTTRALIPQTPTARPVARSLAIAAGFGGPLAAATLQTLS